MLIRDGDDPPSCNMAQGRNDESSGTPNRKVVVAADNVQVFLLGVVLRLAENGNLSLFMGYWITGNIVS
jgi:hypothetical protein